MGRIRAFIVIISVVFLMAEFISPVIFPSKNGEINNYVKPAIQQKGTANLPMSEEESIQKAGQFLIPFVTEEEEKAYPLTELKKEGKTKDKAENREEITGADMLPNLDEYEIVGKRRPVAFFGK